MGYDEENVIIQDHIYVAFDSKAPRGLRIMNNPSVERKHVDPGKGHVASEFWTVASGKQIEWTLKENSSKIQAKKRPKMPLSGQNTSIEDIGKTTSTTDNSKDGTPKHANIFETLLARIHESLQQLHDQDEQTNRSQSGAKDAPTTTSSTSPSALSVPPENPRLSDSSVVPTTANFTKPCRKNRKRITKRRYPSPVPVRGTKAERLREYLKYFPKRPSPCSFNHSSSSQSPSSLESRSVTSEVLPEAEDDLDDH
ncbi:hypothetical protein NEUTE1DRAFT_137135 [Neurospora tetrasperma FGSC 2508]|uniref:Uncharacterized protein n=1 Tax=Neurospora tetrasperma (strain FGSC 2508 / ATCC MYA-4615 / P0657) TaxID=510951 RepID=F8MJP3_NEUT8|nr:uncharacterized protein NEUTE1DRAFT_137135 [Neurospora tetrasperma FGSC 2508]EGO57284.1 hypothetical protein NEUTE1DRAFT_137135 [Neurospora tetrasperma FGSC 2508]